MISALIKEQADLVMRQMEGNLPKYQLDRLSGEVNGLMKAFEIARVHENTNSAKLQ